MAKYEQEIFNLKQAIDYVGRSIDYEKEPNAPKVLNTALNLYHHYFELNKKLKRTPEFPEDVRIENDFHNFQRIVSGNDLKIIIGFFEEISQEKETEEKKQKTEPKKEESSVPSELESLVTQYKEAQANKVTEDSEHSIAETVKRARQAWEEKHIQQLIRENRLKSLIEKESDPQKKLEIELNEKQKEDQVFVDIVDPKSQKKITITAPIELVAKEAISIQEINLNLKLTDKEKQQAVEDISYLAISGNLDLSSTRDLNIVTQLSFRNLTDKKFASPINELDDAVTRWQKELIDNPYSTKPEDIENDIKSADEASQKYISTSTKIFNSKLNNTYLDFDNHLKEATKNLSNIHENLIKAIPYAFKKTDPTPLEKEIKNLESVIRKTDNSALSINPEGMGAKVSAVLETTKSKTHHISPEAVRLYSLGLNKEKLDLLINYAKENPTSPIAKLFLDGNKNNTALLDQLSHQINQITNSKLGEEIKKGQKELKGFSKQITETYNKLSPKLQIASKVIFNPVGTAKAFINKQIGTVIGKQLIKQTGSVVAQKLGGFILKEGLSEGVKTFAKQAAKKIALEAAKKLGFTIVGESFTATLALALGIPTAGASLIIGAVILVASVVIDLTIGLVKKTINSIRHSIGLPDMTTKDVVTGAAAVGIAILAAKSLKKIRTQFIIRTVQAAVVSALSIILISIAVVGAYVGLALMVAPILSTIVQLDSTEKVKYGSNATDSGGPIVPISPGCPDTWPVSGSYMIVQGPGGQFSHYAPGYSQAIDIACGSGTTVVSTTDGTVSFAGLSGEYLSTNIVKVDSSLPNGTSFQVVYAHLSSMSVTTGMTVNVGTVIGASGTAGTGAHLHYEYKGIQYNQCPAGGLQLGENCSRDEHPGPNATCVPDSQPYLYTN